jgi:CheY-like chemotaxis protein
MKAILLVEDTEDDVFFFKRALERKGITHPVHVVNDGEAALNYLRGKDTYADRVKYPLPDLIFLDINLPKLDGHEVLDWLRTHIDIPYLPVVMMSNSTRQEDVDSAYRHGANAYLVKPSDSDSLEGILQLTIDYWFKVMASPTSSFNRMAEKREQSLRS